MVRVVNVVVQVEERRRNRALSPSLIQTSILRLQSADGEKTLTVNQACSLH